MCQGPFTKHASYITKKLLTKKRNGRVEMSRCKYSGLGTCSIKPSLMNKNIFKVHCITTRHISSRSFKLDFICKRKNNIILLSISLSSVKTLYLLRATNLHPRDVLARVALITDHNTGIFSYSYRQV